MNSITMENWIAAAITLVIVIFFGAFTWTQVKQDIQKKIDRKRDQKAPTREEVEKKIIQPAMM